MSSAAYAQRAGKAHALTTAGEAALLALAGFTRSHGATVVSPTAPLWAFVLLRATRACTVTAIKGRRTAGTGATINARRNGAETFLASDLSLTTETVTDGGTVQNAALAIGDTIEIGILTVEGSPTSIAIQVETT